MKKLISVFLFFLLLEGLVSCAFADDISDEAAVAEMNHKIFEANQLNSIFDRHESMSMKYTYPDNPNRDGFIWENDECVYEEWGSIGARYSKQTFRHPCFRRD